MADHRGGNSGGDEEKVPLALSYHVDTDSSSNEGGARERDRLSRRPIDLRITAGGDKDGDKASKLKDPVDLKQPEKTKYPGVRRRRWGKWCSETRDPFLKKRIWLGTFDTAEEASKVYNAKKEEFRARQSAQNLPMTQDAKEVDNSPKEAKTVKSGQDLTRKRGVRMTDSGRWCAKIRDPVMKKQVWLGTFDTQEEASEAYEAKKMLFGSKNSTRSVPESGSFLKTPKTEMPEEEGLKAHEAKVKFGLMRIRSFLESVSSAETPKTATLNLLSDEVNSGGELSKL